MPLWHLPTPLKQRGDLHPNPFGPSRLAPVSNDLTLTSSMITDRHNVACRHSRKWVCSSLAKNVLKVAKNVLEVHANEERSS